MLHKSASQKINLSRIWHFAAVFTALLLGMTSYAADPNYRTFSPAGADTTGGIAASPPPDNASVARRELGLIRGLKFKLGSDATNSVCHTFLTDFQEQAHIRYLSPMIRTNDYGDPRLAPYKRQCPHFHFRRTLGPTGAGPAAFTHPGDENNEDNYNVYLDTRNFQIYELDVDGNPTNGKEIVYYGEAPRLVKSGGIPVSSGSAITQLGRYKVIDLKNCSDLGQMSVGGAMGRGEVLRSALDEAVETHGDVLYQHGVIEFQGTNAAFQLTVYPAGRYANGTPHGPYGSLLLYKWRKGSDGTYGFGQACNFRTRD